MGWKTRTGWNFNGVIIFYRLYFITAGLHSRSVTNFKSVSAVKSREMSPVEFFLPVLFAKNQFDFIFHCPFMNQCQTPGTPTDADYYPLTAGSHPLVIFAFANSKDPLHLALYEPTTPSLRACSVRMEPNPQCFLGSRCLRPSRARVSLELRGNPVANQPPTENLIDSFSLVLEIQLF